MGRPEKEAGDSDVVQACMGNFGRWQLWVCLCISIVKFPVAWHALGIVFLAPPVESWCRKPEALQNLTDEQWRNMSQPPALSGSEGFESCTIYDRNYTVGPYNGTSSNNDTVTCDAWDYDRSVFKETIVSQWDLVCDRKQLVNVAQTVLMFGILMGNVVFGTVADRYGDTRRLVENGLFRAIPPSIQFGPHHNGSHCLLRQGLARIPIGYFAAFSYLNFLLVNKSKDVQNMNTNKATFLDLFRTPNMRLKTICMFFNWIVCGLCFYGLAQYMGQIGGNIFMNVAISGLIGVPGMTICICLMGRFGRKRTLFASQTLTAVSCLLLIAVPQRPEWPHVALGALGLLGTTIAFPTVYLYSAELFPTVVRNVAVGSSSMCARFGSMVAPYITSLSMFGHFVPPLTFGLAPLVGALLCILLPETANTELPDTLEEGENFGKKINRSKTITGSSNNGTNTKDSPL